MDYTFEVKPGFLFVRMGGEFNIDDAKAVFIHTLEACYDHGLAKVFFDCRDVILNRDVDRVKYYRWASAQYRQYLATEHKPLKLAHLVGDRCKSLDNFGQFVARKYGLDSITTTSYAEAFDFLSIFDATIFSSSLYETLFAQLLIRGHIAL